MIAFINEFLSYLLLVIIMAAIAVCGVFTGKKLRDKKNAKAAVEGAAVTDIVEEDKKA
ncbi:MAG: vanadium nitrogenase [Lachnospiraceae bacterium]|nr:vanadium nitrogenase [Lachnospiraceae bacterium]